MKLTTLFSLLFTMNTFAAVYSQDNNLNLNVQSRTVREVFRILEKQSNYRFFYNDEYKYMDKEINICVKNANMNQILHKLFASSDITYKILDKNLVVLTLKNSTKQDHHVTGKIIDAKTNEPLPGVNIVIAGTTLGTATDLDGKFSIEVTQKDAVLIFSFMGYQTQRLTLSGQSELDVQLFPEVKKLDEVVVVGYGTQRKVDLTGSISQITSTDLANTSVSNPIQALQGRVPGVSVMSNDQPGSSPTLRIRGTGSISASNDPLYVVDGFPLMNSNLNDLNPSDIESMDILKDASSTAIYGSRGANGVVMITTKKGKKNRNDVSFSSYYGIQTPDRVPKMLNRDEFINFINDAYTYSRGKAVYTNASPAPNYNTDWQDEIIRNNSAIQEHSINFSGGKDNTTYMLSGSVFSQDGLEKNSGFNKYTIRTNLSHEFNKWLTVGAHIQTGRSTQDIRDNATGDVFRFGWPTTPVRNADGSWYYSYLDPQIDSYIEGTFNPVADAAENTNRTTTDRVLGDVFAELTLVKNLKFRTNYGTDIANAKNYQYSTSKSSAGINTGGKGLGSQTYNRATTQLSENILTYDNNWNNIHRLTVTGVYSYQNYVYEKSYLYGSGFANDGTGANDMSLADPASVKYSSDKYSNKLASWTSRVAYSYKDKYMLTATGRFDGSSRFGQHNKWGFFPSVGLGWRINEESFMKSLSAISNFKLRASYGITGNQEISDYASLPKLSSTYYVYNNAPILGYTESLGNSDLKWEKTAQIDAGLDLSLWNRLDFTFDYYRRNTTNLLYNVPIPTTSGYTSMLQNIGEVRNTGYEFSTHANVLNHGLKWDVTFNISYNKNKIVSLYGNVTKINLGGSYTTTAGLARFLEVGKPVNAIWARESAGLIRTQDQLNAYKAIRASAQLGEEMYVDKDGDKSITLNDYKCLGSITPDLYYGISTSLEYKNFKLDIYGQGSGKYASVAGCDNNAGYGIGFATNTSSYLLYGENQILNSNYIPTEYAYKRMWSTTNPNGSFPRAGAKEVYFSDRTNGGWYYIILKNVKLNYSLNPVTLNKLGIKWISALSVYVNAQNYYSYANQRGYNPENGDVSYPWAKTLLFGINASF